VLDYSAWNDTFSGDTTSAEVRRRLVAEEWYEVATKGSHVQFKHPTKPGRVTVTLPEDVLEEIDRFAETHGFSRSGFLAKAAAHMIAAAREPKRDLEAT
jgi:predicted RNA binding protein YcfA (HicA-like mRNA interferase family)